MKRPLRLHPATWGAAAWALVAAGQTERQLLRDGLRNLSVAKPPPLPAFARRGVLAVLHRRGATCLVRAAVLQRWDASHGVPREIVIGVTIPSEGFQAHAWLDGDDPCHHAGYHELLRYPPP